MPRHTLKLLALLTLFAVAPAKAGYVWPSHGANHSHSACPYARARAEAAARAAALQLPPPSKAPTRITLLDRVPGDGWLFGFGRGAFATP
jgi:hypothetical protein